MQEGFCRGEVLKAVFPLLKGEDLASCMCVAKLWREAAMEDYLWKQLCSRKWPSICRDSSPLAVGAVRGYHTLYASFARRYYSRPLPSPKLSFEDLEFYVDVWVGECTAYSTVVPGPVVRSRIGNPPPGICQSMENHLKSQAYKMTIPVVRRFQVSFNDDIYMSMLIRRRDDERMACLVGRSRFDYIDGPEYRAHAFDYLRISSFYPFVSEIRAWVALLLVDAKGGNMEVFGIELDFLDAANSDVEVLCLLDILDWK